MTDVGKIKLGVEIDARDLSTKLGEAVRKAIAPALMEIQRELNKVQREYDETAERSAVASEIQKAGAKEVADALGKVERKQAEVAATTKASTESQSRDVRQVTRAWQEQTAAIAANTAARLANAAAPTGGGPGRGGGANGSGFGRGGGGRGGALGFLTGPVGLNTVALGAQALPAATTAVVALVGAIQQLGQAGLAMPAVFGAMGASLGTAMLGMHGMKDAVKALNKAAGPDASAADLKKAAEGLKDMSTAGKETAIEISKLTQGPLKDLQKGVQQNMFAGVAGDLDAFSKKAIPGVTTGLNSIGTAWNGTMRTLMGSLGADKNLSLIDRFLGNTAQGQKNANKAIDPLVHAFATLMSTGGEFLPRLGDALGKVADRFDNFISKAGKSGQLWKWIDEGLNGLRALGNAVLNIGKTLTGLTSAASGDGGFLGWLEKATGRMQAFVNSADGQGKLSAFFRSGRDGMHEWADLFKALGPTLLRVIEGFAMWGQVMLPIVTALAEIVNWLGKVPGLIQGIVVALMALKTTSGVLGMLGMAGGGGLLATGGGAGKGKGGPGLLLGGGKMGLAALAAAGIITSSAIQQESGSHNQLGRWAGAAGTIGTSALLGGTIGSAIAPGAGTLIGAGLGAAAGAALAGYNVIAGESAEKAAAAAAAHDKLAASLAAEQRASVLTAAAAKNLNDALIGSKGALDPAALSAVGSIIDHLPDTFKGLMSDDQVAKMGEILRGLNMSSEQIAGVVTGPQPYFDALIANLNRGDAASQQLANSLQHVRDNALDAAHRAGESAPLIDKLAASMGVSAQQAAVNLQTALKGIPQNVPIKVDAPGATAVLDIFNRLGIAVRIDNDKNIVTTAPLAPAVIQLLQDITGLVVNNNNKTITVGLDQGALQQTYNQLGALSDFYKNIFGPILGPPPVVPGIPNAPGGPPAAPPGSGPPMPWFNGPGQRPGGAMGGVITRRGFMRGGVMPGYSPGIVDPLVTLAASRQLQQSLYPIGNSWFNASNPGFLPGNPQSGMTVGGVLPGYSPGVDNMMVPLSGGEGILIPEAMRALGADWLYGVNSRFRPGISRAGYAAGGITAGFEPGGVNVHGDDQSVIGLLTQIRDLLAGKGGVGNPLATTANSTSYMAQNARGTGAGGAAGTGGKIGPFGTPLKPRNRAYEMAAAVISSLGGNPETFLGPNPVDYFGAGGAGAGGRGGVPGAGVDMGRYSGALSAFAKTGNLADVTSLGLDANDPIIRAIVSARGKKKGGLGSDAISGLVEQIIGGGGYSGVLDPSNSSLISALQTFREKLMKGGPGASPTGLPPPAFGGAGFSGGAGSAEALIAFAQAANGGKYAAASDLSHGLADCSGAVSDLVEFLTQGSASPARLFDTHSEAAALSRLGATRGFVPGSLNIGFNEGHTAATLPNGVNFESGGGGGGVVYGGPVGARDKQFGGNIWSLPTNWTGAVPAGFGGVPAGFGGGGMPGMPVGSPTSLGPGGGGGVVPVYVTNWGGGGPGSPGVPGLSDIPGLSQVGGAGLTAGGAAAATVAGDVIHGAASAMPARLVGSPTHPDTALATLVRTGNGFGALAKAAGFSVPNYSRNGNNMGELERNVGPGYDAAGRLYSDTGALVSRTFTDLGAQFNSMRSQVVGVTGQVVTKLSDKVLTPVVSAGVTSGFGAINASVFKPQGTAMGQAAAPIIADALKSSLSSGGGGNGIIGGTGYTQATLGETVDFTSENLFAGGGLVSGGTPGVDSVPILAQQNEWILNTDDVARLGGNKGVARFVGALRSGKLLKLASGGSTQGSGVSSSMANSMVGADFFGVSQVPIIGAIVNMLVQVLLKVIGVNIDVRNTLFNLSGDFRAFRGDAFKTFDAQGRLLNDTAALMDRSSTSDQAAADERIRILKIVIEALIKYIIEKVIVPIMKAVANAAIQAGSAAAGAAINTQAPGAGSIVSSFLSSAGQAGVDIAAEIGTDFALAISSTLIDAVGEGLQSIFPQLMTNIFGGQVLEIVVGPLAQMMQLLLGGFLGSITALFGGVFGGAASLVPGLPLPGLAFDDGGVASGIGYLPKATMDDELVLSPRNTDIFTKFVAALSNGGFGGNRTVHAPITVMQAGPETPRQVQDRLLRAMP